MSDSFMPGVNELPEIVERNLDELVLWEDNPRIVKGADMDRLIEQIKLLGVYKPLLINQDNIVLGGNMRTNALRKMGVKKTLCSLVKTDNKAQMMEYALSDNDQIGVTDEQAVAEYITLNPSIRSELFAINSSPMKLVSTVLQELSPEVEEDEAPPPVADVAISKLGEVYQLGRHRVMCGDATDFGAVSDLMNGKETDMVFTDPPYNVDYEGMQNSKQWDKIANDTMSPEKFQKFLTEVFTNIATVSKNGAALYICHADKSHIQFRNAFEAAGYEWRATIIWSKNSPAFNFAQYKYKHEPIFYCYKKGQTVAWYGDRTQNTIWESKKETGDHPTIKPISLIARAVNNSSKSGDIIVDLFGGSGSTLIACEQLDRTCYMMELDPKYTDVIRKRYWKFTHDGNEEGWQDGTPLIS